MNRSPLIDFRPIRFSLALVVGLSALAALATGSSGCQKDEGATVMIDPNSGSGGLDGGLTGIGIATGGGSGSSAQDAAVEMTTADGPVAAVDVPTVEVAPELPPPPPVDAGPETAPPPIYPGRPWNNTPQTIPGMVQASLYDQGGEGVAYHDGDPNNKGADQARTENNRNLPELTFRADEGVDLRSTRQGMDKYTDGTTLQAGQLYVGWTEPGEWINYTVNVTEAGHYTIGALVATMVDATRVTFTLEDGTSTGPRALPWTRSYTAWSFASNIATLDLTAGPHVLTMRFETAAVNIEYLLFVRNP